MRLSQAWHTDASSANPALVAVNNPHSVSDTVRADPAYQQELEWSTDGQRLNIVANIPDQYFNPGFVQMYPQWYWGIKDRQLPSGDTGVLPCKVSELSQLVSSYSVDVTELSPRANVAAEIFVHNSPSPRNERGPNDTREYEVMYWTHRPVDQVIGLGTVILDLPEFEVRIKPGNRRYAAFILKVPPANGADVNINWLSLLSIVNRLATETGQIDVVPMNGYVTSVENGVEMWAGRSIVAFENMQFTAVKGTPQVTMPDGAMAPVEDMAPAHPVQALSTLCGCLQAYTRQHEDYPLRNASAVIPLLAEEIELIASAIKGTYV